MKVLATLSLTVLAGCAAAGPGRQVADRAELTREEIAETSYTNTFDLVHSVRPHWLRIRGRTSFRTEPEIWIYVDGVRVGGPDFLRQLVPGDVENIRYYDAREAQFRFGVGHTHGALSVTLRR
jgi:hypothetical protein